MSDVLHPRSVIIGSVTTAWERDPKNQDPEQKALVGGQEKTCRGFVSTKSGSMHVLCNSERFLATAPADQYRLIHHEYAGLARVEQNAGAASDYSISAQITDFLEPRTVLKLAVKKRSVEEPSARTPSRWNSKNTPMRATIGTQLTRARRARVLVGWKSAWDGDWADNRRLNSEKVFIVDSEMTFVPPVEGMKGEVSMFRIKVSALGADFPGHKLPLASQLGIDASDPILGSFEILSVDGGEDRDAGYKHFQTYAGGLTVSKLETPESRAFARLTVRALGGAIRSLTVSPTRGAVVEGFSFGTLLAEGGFAFEFGSQGVLRFKVGGEASADYGTARTFAVGQGPRDGAVKGAGGRFYQVNLYGGLEAELSDYFMLYAQGGYRGAHFLSGADDPETRERDSVGRGTGYAGAGATFSF